MIEPQSTAVAVVRSRSRAGSESFLGVRRDALAALTPMLARRHADPRPRDSALWFIRYCEPQLRLRSPPLGYPTNRFGRVRVASSFNIGRNL